MALPDASTRLIPRRGSCQLVSGRAHVAPHLPNSFLGFEEGRQVDA